MHETNIFACRALKQTQRREGKKKTQTHKSWKKAHRSYHMHIEWARTLVVRHFNDVTSFVCGLYRIWMCLYVNRKRKEKLHYRHNTNLYSIHYTLYTGMYVLHVHEKKINPKRNPSHPTTNVKTSLQQKRFIHRVANGRQFQIFSLTDKYQYIFIDLWLVIICKRELLTFQLPP